MPDSVCVKINLPIDGTANDIQRAIDDAIANNVGIPDAQKALSSLFVAVAGAPPASTVSRNWLTKIAVRYLHALHYHVLPPSWRGMVIGGEGAWAWCPDYDHARNNLFKVHLSQGSQLEGINGAGEIRPFSLPKRRLVS